MGHHAERMEPLHTLMQVMNYIPKEVGSLDACGRRINLFNKRAEQI
jgi:hypothetical protein